MTATGCPAFTTTVGVIDRVHGHTANGRADTHPAFAAGFAEVDVHVVRVGHGTDCREAGLVDHAHFAGLQTDLSVTFRTAHELSVGPCGAGQLAALAGLELDIVDDRPDRHGAKRHGVAGLHVRALGGKDGVAFGQTLRSQDVGLLAVLVLDQGDEGRAVGIIFQTQDRRFARLHALEVDLSV